MTTEQFDIVIVGAGLSGVGAACHLRMRCPDKSFVILESRDAIGGTWDLFRYPGIRSDSDMHTLGYGFRPWLDSKAIADGPAILHYIRETAAEFGVDRHVRYRHAVRRAEWSSADSQWTVEAGGPDGRPLRFRCNMLLMCAGYYSYEQGYLPEFEGREDFAGRIVHPQAWPEALDYRGRRVVVIGSGATAMTLVPALARQAGHVVMLQRSPTYVICRPDEDLLAKLLRRFLPARWAYGVTRWKNILLQHLLYRQARAHPARMKRKLIRWAKRELPEGYDVERHFTPAYDPWEQRLCLLPNADLFGAIRAGKASVVTERIDRFTETGIRLASGNTLDADIVVTATGLQLQVLGSVELVVDGRKVDFGNTFAYKGIMLSDVPNLVSTFGYLNASWTLRADLVAEFACRLINRMDRKDADTVVPVLRPGDRDMRQRPWVTGFSSGYIQRMLGALPKQGDREPWLNPQDYLGDLKRFRKAPLDDGVLVFSGRSRQAAA
jgi:cation diffusion facilitator CzcD-associated flavoprotein CzcO